MYSPPDRFNPFSGAFSWGWQQGQLGVASSGDVGRPTAIPRPEDSPVPIRLAACGGTHTLLLLDDNRLFSCGTNTFGELGLGDTLSRSSLTEISSPHITPSNPIISLACGDQHCLALCQSGLVLGWGKNTSGELGLPSLDPTSYLSPTPLTHPTLERTQSHTICRLSAGGHHSSFLRSDGRLFSCGEGSHGQLGLGTNRKSLYPQEAEVDPNVLFIEVSCRDTFCVGLSQEYEVWCWGGKRYDYAEEGERDLVGGGEPECTDGVQWNRPRKVCGNLVGRRVISVCAGRQHAMILTSDGSVWMFGHSLENCGYIAYVEEIVQAKKRQAEVVSETAKELVHDWIDVSDKFVIHADPFRLYKVHDFDRNVVRAIACCDSVNYAVSADGKVYAWGQSEKLTLGLGTEETIALRPVPISNPPNLGFVAAVVTGTLHAIALTGSENNFQNRHLDLGQTQPGVVMRLPVGRSEE